MKNTWKVLSGTAFSAILLAGTITASTHVFADASDEITTGSTTKQSTTAKSSNGQNSQATTNSNGAPAQPPAPPAPPANGELPAPPANGELPAPPADAPPVDKYANYDRAHGKVTAVSGNTITIETPPAPPAPGAGPLGLTSKTTSKSGTVTSSTYSNNNNGSVSKNTYGETLSFTINSSTEIEKVSGGPGKDRTETDISLSDVQVGDHVDIILEKNTKTVKEIEVHDPPALNADGTPVAPPVPGTDAPPAPPAPRTDAPPVPKSNTSSSSSAKTGTSSSSSSSQSSGS